MEDQVYYYKLKGDYNRYLCEVSHNTERTERWRKVAKDAEEAYTQAMNIAEKMKTTDPTRLGLHLNFSVFHYETREQACKAIELAQDAFDKAMADIEELSNGGLRDTTVTLDLIRQNLGLWKEEKEIKEHLKQPKGNDHPADDD